MNAPSDTLDRHPFADFGRLGIGALSLLVANAAVLTFVLGYGVTAFQLVLVFWCECVWIGVFNAIKLLTASLIGHPFENRAAEFSRGAAVFLSLGVICVSSSAFFTLLGILLAAILVANESLTLSSHSDEVLNHIGLVLGTSGVLMAGHAASFVVNFLILGEFNTARVGMLVAQPFRRCGALFVAIAASTGLILAVPTLTSTAAFGALVLAAKVAMDLPLHFAERRSFAGQFSGSNRDFQS